MDMMHIFNLGIRFWEMICPIFTKEIDDSLLLHLNGDFRPWKISPLTA